MDSLPPIACSCRRVLGNPELILTYIRKAKSTSEEVREIKESREREIERDNTLTRYRKVLLKRSLEDEMKKEIQNRLENILIKLLGGEKATNYEKICCRVYLNEQATLGINGERYDSMDYYIVK